MGQIFNKNEGLCDKIMADIILKNGWIVNVFSGTIFKGDVAIKGDRILGVGKFEGVEEIDCEGCFIAPGFIDAHVHIESSKVIPEVFSRALIKRGVTACIADPHEIANVLGIEGIRFMLENSKNSVVDIYYMMPSCVPSSEFDNSGAVIKSESLKEFISHPLVLGLGEVMDVPAVLNREEDMVKKLYLFKDKIIDGHCPSIDSDSLNYYVYSGIKTDHECTTPEMALEEIKRGMHVMLREGSAAKSMKKLLPAVDDNNFKRFVFCTDDKDIADLEREGSIDHNIRIAIKRGINPVMAITMATLNTAECYGLKGIGAVAPGYSADLVILSNIEKIDIKQVIKGGKIYREDEYNPSIKKIPSVSTAKVKEEMLKVPAVSNTLNVIKFIKGFIETQRVEREAIIENGFITGIKSDDILKIAVFERHKKSGKYAVGYIEGLGFKNCSIAQTISHDSHNIICAGSSDKDMEIAVNRVIDMDGGIAVASEGSIFEELSLPIAGLMTFERPEYVIKKLDGIKKVIKELGLSFDINIVLALSFLALPVVPEIKITSNGLYCFSEGKFIDLFCSNKV